MRIAVIGPSGSGKTQLSSQLAENLGLRHIEIDALHHGPNWESCSPDELRERVAVATEGDDWVSDGAYHRMIGELVFERAETVAWLTLFRYGSSHGGSFGAHTFERDMEPCSGTETARAPGASRSDI